MKKLILVPILFLASISLSQEEENEIYRMTRLRSECVERSLCEVSVYPNPSYGQIKIKAPEGSTCQIYSSMGTYVGTWTVGEKGLSLSDLPSGSYIATVNYNNINRVSRVVIL